MSIVDAVQIQRTWWSSFALEDVERLTRLFAEEATFFSPCLPPFAGRQNIRLYYEDLFAKTTDFGGSVLGPYMLHDGAFAVWTRSSFRHRASGAMVELPLVAFFTYRHGGKIIAYEEYWDTRSMLRQLDRTSCGSPPTLVASAESPFSSGELGR